MRTLKKSLASFLVITFVSVQFCLPSFAGKAVVMTDDQMDQIYANGLFFSVDVSFGPVTDLNGNNSKSNTNSTPASNSPISNSNIVQNPNSSIQYVNFTPPLQPSTTPQSIATPN